MHPETRTNIAPLGSTLYYSTLMLPDTHKQAILALHQYWQTLWHIAESFKEADVAKLKLAWWRQELDNIFTQKAQHPVGQALAKVIQDYALPHSLFYPPLEAAEQQLSTPSFPTQIALETCYKDLAGNLSIAICLVLDPETPDEATAQYAVQSSIGIEIIRHLTQMVAHLQHRHCYFPESDLIEIDHNTLYLFAINKHQRPNTLQKTQLATLIKKQLARAEQYYQQALSYLPTHKYRILKAHRLYGYLHHKQGQLIRKHCDNIFDYQASLTPFKRAWLTWRFK